MSYTLKPPSIFVVVVASYGLFGQWLLTIATLLLLIFSSPKHAIAQAGLVLIWIGFYTGTEFPIEHPVIAQETTFRFAQLGIWFIAWLLDKPNWVSRSVPETLLPYAGALRRILWVMAYILIAACSFRSMSWFHAAWAWAILVVARAVPKPESTQDARRAAIGTALVTALSILLSIAILEVGARLLLARPPLSQEMYEEDSEYIMTVRPNSTGNFDLLDNNKKRISIPVQISSQGIRDREFGPKAPDEFRIVALGDSYTMGHGLRSEESYPHVLEELLNTYGLRKRITVINCGVGGFSPWQERGLLKRRGFSFSPDLVILQLFPSNDVAGSYSRVSKRLKAVDATWENRLEMFRRKNEFPVRCERWLQKHSWLYLDLLTMYKKDGLIMYPIADLRFLAQRDYTPVKPWSDRNANQEVCLITWYPELQEAWDLYAEDIAGINDDCRARGVDLIAFAHGDPISINDDGWTELNKFFSKTPYEANKDIRLTNELLDYIGTPRIDVVQPLKDYPDRKSIYFQYDGHFTPTGARIVAATIADYLLTEYFPSLGLQKD